MKNKDWWDDMTPVIGGLTNAPNWMYWVAAILLLLNLLQALNII